MAFFSEIRNDALIEELLQELNTDVLLFGADGFIYFGNLQGISDCRIVILSPAIEADSSENGVEILTPGGELNQVAYARVDLWTVVAKATGIVHDPIYHPRSHFTSPGRPSQENESAEAVLRQESHKLIRQLKRMIGDEVVITTLGGFLFEGTLIDVDDKLAIISVKNIFGPGTSTSISNNDVRSAVVNLEALTAVSGVTS